MATEKNTINLPPISAWEAVLLRLTAFRSSTDQTVDNNWWAQVVGEPPEKTTEQSRAAERVTEGLYKNGRLILDTHPNRIDWNYAVVEDAEFEKILTLGSFPDVTDTFRELMNRWLKLENRTDLVRLAFGAVLLQPVESHNASYKLLSQYLPFFKYSEDTSDFLYQINRRKASSSIPGLGINRLSKWASAVFKNVMFSFSIASQTPASVQQSEAFYACRLELDINSIAEYEGTLPNDKLLPLLDELIELGKGIAQKGDVT